MDRIMTDPSAEWQWRRPPFTREGQEAFWNRQAPDYASRNMTDNEGETVLVKTLSFDVTSHGHTVEDVVTLGGAVGCRDPLIVTTALRTPPKTIYFNDLSKEMTQAARKGALSEYDSVHTKIHLLPGPVHEIASSIPCRPRRVLIGVYRAAALTASLPLEGYGVSGVDEYLHSTEVLGETFLFEPLLIDASGEYRETGIRFLLNTMTAERNLEKVKAGLEHSIRSGAANVIRVVGRHEGKEGYFLSHWFTEGGIMALVRAAFGSDRIGSLSLERCAKGFVICIDPKEPPQGIVTMLNNVLGNIIPDEQLATLVAIDALSS